MVNQEDLRFCQELKKEIHPGKLIFKRPARTSRDTLHTRDVWYIVLSDSQGRTGIGECAPIPGLSAETNTDTEALLKQFSLTGNTTSLYHTIAANSSVTCALEMALCDYKNGGSRNVFGEIDRPIEINGLIWMNQKETMLREAREKIALGFRCIKFKVGALQFTDELDILEEIRSDYSPGEIEIRLDANGAFTKDNVNSRLDALSRFTIHSIEQPIKPGQWSLMREVIKHSPIPIALDEELIGIEPNNQQSLLEALQPHYLILKPALHGGFTNCDQWIQKAEAMEIGWWSTSALESNIGLNAVAQWAASHQPLLPQGLGTGSLYENNIPSPIEIHQGFLRYNQEQKWDVSSIFTGLSSSENS